MLCHVIVAGSLLCHIRANHLSTPSLWSRACGFCSCDLYSGHVWGSDIFSSTHHIRSLINRSHAIGATIRN